MSILRERVDFEAKKAQGQDGRGAIPNSFWETYSSFANTNGGFIVLGAEERDDGSINIIGIKSPAKLIADLWNTINNPQKISKNLLLEENVYIHEVDGHSAVVVQVPRANRVDRPVYLGSNPLKGSYRRNHDGDYLCSEAEIKRMLGEATEPAQDHAIIPGFTIDDLDGATITAFRNLMGSLNPGHPFLIEDEKNFLRQLKAWRRDRATDIEGITIAGLLMFGKLHSIRDHFPHYSPDYRELPDIRTEIEAPRYLDRISADGTWSGNLFDFYRRVFPRLKADLKVPFILNDLQHRQEETPVHAALREALSNSLVHADHRGTNGIVIVRRRSNFEFRNPGDLRLPKDSIFQGGVSDCRNPALQAMFQLVGVGERMGSGLPTIIQAWKSQHWRLPSLDEDTQHNMVTLNLSMASLLPSEALIGLEQRFPQKFRHLPELERLAMATALIEDGVSNVRMQELCDDHPNEITKMFQRLVEQGFLVAHGRNRGKRYEVAPQPSEAYQNSLPFEHNDQSESSVIRSVKEKADQSQSSIKESSNPDIIIDSFENWEVEFVKSGRSAPAGIVRLAIITVCSDYKTLDEIARAINRRPASVRTQHLRAMIIDGTLKPKFPDKINHPQQAYIRSSPLEN